MIASQCQRGIDSLAACRNKFAWMATVAQRGFTTIWVPAKVGAFSVVVPCR
jgi:hypothetical protein